jgi:crotonobetainyl-CoA:carnitine CoA-transferase CaiB-like acyl-CoA transferase
MEMFNMSNGALEDIKVIDLGTMVSAPYCAKLFADMGADVVKVETQQGDPAREYGPFPDGKPHPEKSGLYMYNNTNKRGLKLDFTNKEDIDTFKQLILWADILIDNHPPAFLEAIDLGWEALHQLNPNLVYTSITPYGRTGPRAGAKGDELTLMHAGSLGTLMPGRSSDIDKAPVKMGGFQVGYHGGIVAAMTTLAVATNLKNTGGGQLIDVSLQEVIAALVSSMIISTVYHQTTWSRVPDRPPAMGRMKTSDGYVVFAAADDHHFHAFREIMGKPDWIADDMWDNRHYRSHHMMDIAPQMDAWMLTQKKHDLHHKLSGVGIPIGPVNTAKEVLESPQYAARDFFIDVDHPEAGKYKYPGLPYKTTANLGIPNNPAPLSGQHNEEIKKHISETARPSTGTSGRPQSPKLPLEGVRVLDFNWVWAGPYACMMLAALGAEVIKIEGHNRSDLVRRAVIWPLAESEPMMLPPNQPMSYNALNLGKKSLTLDLSKPEGKEIARKLVEKADVVIDNMRPGAMIKLGLGYDDLKNIKSDIIAINLSSRGHGGPESSHLGFANIHQAVGGLVHISGHPDGHPTHGSPGDADLMNGLSTAYNAIAALHHRNRTGEGQFIDYSQCEGVTALLGEVLLEYQMTGEIPERMGNAHPYYAPHSVYKAWGIDRWLALEIHTDEEFATLAKIIDQPELAQDPKFSDMAARKQNEAELDKIIGTWVQQRDRDWMANELTAAGLAAAPARDNKDIYADPHLKARGAFVKVDHPELGELQFINPPWKFSGFDIQSRRAPLLGEHNDYVLKELLGFSTEEVDELTRNNIIMSKEQSGKPLDK